MLDQILVSLVNIGGEISNFIIIFLTLFTQGHVDALDTEVACHGNSSVDVVTKTFKQFCSLSLDDNRLLFVTCVKSQVHELLRVVIHLLSLGFCGLNEIESYIKDQIWQEPKENLLEVIILCGKTQVFECFNYEIADSFLIEQLLKVRPLPEYYQGLDHHWD